MVTNSISSRSRGFTIVELLIVVVVIAILAAITIVAYNGIANRAKESTLKTDLEGAAKQLHIVKIEEGAFPGDTSAVQKSDSTTFDYTHTANSFCLTATNGTLVFHTTDSGGIQAGECPALALQTITSANCPTTRTRAVDARDNHTYWVQQLGDGKCWMLTNLGYAGGGTNTYGDTRTLTNGTGGSTTYTVASYYVVPSTTNFTTEPTNPSTATNGTGQYGYLYNWCAAMGAPIAADPNPSSACANATTPAPDTSRSVCPAGWRLPVGNGGEFTALNNAVNSGSTSSDAGLIGSPWLAQRSGSWSSGFYNQGSSGVYWSSSQGSAASAYRLAFNSSTVYLASGNNKNNGFAVRCVAS